MKIYSFPSVSIVVPVPKSTNDMGVSRYLQSSIQSHNDVGVFDDGRSGKVLSGLGKLSAALTGFLNLECKVCNISCGIESTESNIIAYITPVLMKLRAKGSILVVAAGNKRVDTDIRPDLLSSFITRGMDNIVAVAALNQDDLRLWECPTVVRNDGSVIETGSNFGKESVLLAAPGEKIVSSTTLHNKFGRMTGTSQAAPKVAAVLAMMANRFPTRSYSELIDRLRMSVDKLDSLQSNTISGGKLNMVNALRRDWFGKFGVFGW